MKNIYLIIITFFFLTNKSTAQVPGIKWQRCIGGLQNEAMFDLNSEADANISNTIKSKGLIIAKGGGYFIAGQTNSSTGDVPVNAASNQPGTIAVLRLDNDRNILWKKTLGGLNSSGKYDEFNAIIETSDQGCMVIGYTASTTGQAAGNHGGSDILLGKFSASGTLEWSKVFGGTADEQGVNIIQTSDSGYVFLGNTYSTSGQVQGNHGSSDVWMVKIDKIGTLKWQKCVGTAASETAFKLEKTSNEGFIYLWQGANCTGFTLTKTDSLGFELSQTCINGFTAFGGMSQTYDGGYIIAGTGPSLSGMAVKIDNAGLIQWQKILNGSGTDVFNDAKQAPDGGYIIAGGTRSNDGDLTGLGIHSKNDAWIVKLNAGGQLEWQKLLGGSEGDVAVTIFPTLDNDYVFYGLTNSHDGDVSGIHLNTNPGPNGPLYTVDWWLVKLSSLNMLQGYVFEDANSNGVKDAGEVYANNVTIKSVKGTDERFTIPTNGVYTNYIDTGTYTTTIIPENPYYAVSPSAHTTVFSSYNRTDTLNIAIQPTAGIKDLEVNITPIYKSIPGFQQQYKVQYQNNGTETITTGSVIFIKSPLETFTSASPTVSNINGDTLRWDYSNLHPRDVNWITINCLVQSPPIVSIGDTVSCTAIVNPITGDVKPEDNTFKIKEQVRGSFDPNNKSESHAGSIKLAQISNGEYLTYTIQFQNTGTDTAFNVYIRDTLNSKLDWNTFKMVSSSHNFNLNVTGGSKCVWTFSDIKLVDSNTNEPMSHGYLTYSIKPKSTLTFGDTIKNSAAIFFDYNLPVFTNTENTRVTNEVLPIKLLNFSVKREAKTNVLHWSTTQEINLKYFEVEKSIDGRQFSVLGTLNGGVGHYRFIDTKPEKGSNFYRLNMIDKDGTSEYSSIKVLNNTLTFDATIYPNPAKQNLQLQIVSDEKTDMRFEIISADGKILITNKFEVKEGTSLKVTNISSLTTGSYFIKFANSKNQITVLKFQKE